MSHLCNTRKVNQCEVHNVWREDFEMNGFIADALQSRDRLPFRNTFLWIVVAVSNLANQNLANLIISRKSFCFGFNFLSDLIKICKDLKQTLKKNDKSDHNKHLEPFIPA